ncbi:SoxR reducing system RseC family protein [Clostridium estertheticum]|uniref:Fis family transcriptional regulator n=1 Tax=Clostridium estertheticum TaxID=238834 RepID=A0A7Y3WR90_9CLOT|nr:SoxR reducing system RseC family protein [Clostridium estertheticum]MBW9172301.1 SoxR reducing system RseC family protein [Clostridium estertheticum]NNU74639.1 Fis family transcriptional regulator [Clostridium estertheticum]WBL48867.1 SoxR reducing system RseC family protein [Clostridium estertheticum]WLC76920.1 SoxR reducing system RseC family protein [Clostridium estertheticum]
MKTDKSKEKGTVKEKKTNMLLASFMLFVFPIIIVVVAVVLGGYIGKYIGAPIQISRVCGGIIGFIFAIVVIKLFDKSAAIDDKEEKIYWEDL